MFCGAHNNHPLHTYTKTNTHNQRDSPYLHTFFLEVDFEGQLFPEEDVGVVGLGEGSLQLLKLLLGEDGPVAPLPLPAGARPAEEGRGVQSRILAGSCGVEMEVS